jgi:[ribosomal protein S5]-alanine N-acetyltransferase
MLETDRLILHPLTYGQLLKYIQADHSLEAELELKSSNRTISDELKEALEQTLLPNMADASKNYLYCTLWTIICKEENIMVGDICIVGEPNDAGEIEIGYGTYDAYQSKGFMTEAVGALILWAKEESGVTSITASTDIENIGSNKILQKNNFILMNSSESMMHWKLMLGKT